MMNGDIEMANIERSRSSPPPPSAEHVRNRTQHSISNRDDLNLQVQAETKRILRQMPSRNRVDFVNLSKTIAKLRPPECRILAQGPPGRKPSMFEPTRDKADGTWTLDDVDEGMVAIQRKLADENIDLTTDQGVDVIEREFREMKVPLQLRRIWKRKVMETATFQRKRSLMVSITRRYKLLSERLKSVLTLIDFWHAPIYHVTGIHGSGVTSYFQFLRWLFWLNLPLSLIIFFFIMIPQWLWAAFNDVYYCGDVDGFSVANFFTGEGWLKCSVLFYGYYTNETINLDRHSFYSMPQAYFFIVWLCFVICLVAVLYSSLSLYRKNYIESLNVDVMKDVYVGKVLCGWDYQIRSSKSAALKRSAYVKDLKEHLVKIFEDVDLGINEYYFSLLRRTGLLCAMLVILISSCLIVYFVAEATNSFQNTNYNSSWSGLGDVASERKQETPGFWSNIALAFTMSWINYLVPYSFDALVSLQRYSSPNIELYILLASDFLLYATSLITVFCYWLTSIGIHSSTISCWETGIGQQIYRIIVFDFIFFAFFNLLVELSRKFLADATEKFEYFRPSFHIGRSTLHLAYAQALCWLGAFFSPVVYLITTVKLFAFFYIKFFGACYICQKTAKLWRASQALVMFFFVLCSFLVITVGCVAFANYNLSTSKDCGPLRQFDNDYDVMINLLAGFSIYDKPDSLLTVALAVLTSQGMVISFLLALCVIVYWERRRSHAWSTMVCNMKEQLILENKDKQFLLQIMQKLIERDLTIRRQLSYPTRSGKS